MRRMPTIEVTIPTSSDCELEHDALFDVQLEEGLDVGTLGFGEPVGIAADPAQRIAQFFAARLGQVEHGRIQHARHAAAADT